VTSHSGLDIFGIGRNFVTLGVSVVTILDFVTAAIFCEGDLTEIIAIYIAFPLAGNCKRHALFLLSISCLFW
jgi:hypothetical protein